MYLDTEAVMTEELAQRIVTDAIPRTTSLNASDLGGPHNAGFYMLYRHVLISTGDTGSFPDVHEFKGELGQQLKFTTRAMLPGMFCIIQE